MYNLTLLINHYTRVVVELSNGRICGLKYDETNTLCCVWKDYWDKPDHSEMCGEIDIVTAYNQNSCSNRNIVKCSILSSAERVDQCVRTQTMPYAWDCVNTTNNLKFKKGDNVIIKSTEHRDSYKGALECIGTIVDAECVQYIDDERITYRVRIDNLDNKYQTDGLWVFHEEKSLELCDDAQNDTFNYWLSARTNGKQQYLINKNYGITRADYPAIQQLHTLSDYIDDCIAQAVLDQPTEETKTFNIKGENEMKRIVELYEERNRGKIYTEYNKKCTKIKLADENYKVYKECLDKLIPIYEKTKQSFHNITEPYLSEETAKKLDELALKKEADLTKLENELDEIKAQISMCETYEQKQSVLKLYKVIDENGKLNA